MADTYNLSTTNQLIPLNDEDNRESASVTYTIKCDAPFDMAVVDHEMLDNGDGNVDYARYEEGVEVGGTVSYSSSNFKTYSLMVKGVRDGKCMVDIKKGPYVEKQVVEKNVTFEDEGGKSCPVWTYIAIILFVIIIGLILYKKLNKSASPMSFFGKGGSKKVGSGRVGARRGGGYAKKSFGPF